MKLIVRGCGVAAAVLALAATAYSDPLAASEVQGVQPTSNYLSHAVPPSRDRCARNTHI
jgi:hypothetical protein